jgi:dCMP deaminase
MGVALLAKERSKDPVTQTGAVIVDRNKNIISVGYNGFPIGCSDDDFPWDDTPGTNPVYTKHLYVVHAELNAILNARQHDLTNCTIYTTLFPCADCAKAIIQTGIRYVVYMDIKAGKDYTIAAKRMFNAAHIATSQYAVSGLDIRLSL